MGSGGVARAAGLFLFVVLSVLGEAEGSYRFGTLSWRAVKDAPAPFTVEFELVTAWRRDFQWVYVKQVSNGGGVRPLTDRPIVGDVLRVTGLFDQAGFADLDGTQALQGGKSEIMFHAGDGTKYFVDMTVTAFSESENWVMATTLIRHTYKAPFAGKRQNVYPEGFTYEAGSQEQLDANQPFSHIPWTAAFVGCCRADLPTLPAVGGNARKPYRVETWVDLTDRDNAPASRTLPIVSVRRWNIGNSGSAPTFAVVARDQFMPSSDPPPRMSGGISNYPVQPSNAFANLTYAVATAADLGLTSAQYTPYSGITIDSTGNATFRASVEGYYQVAIVIMSDSSKTIVDFFVRAVSGASMPFSDPPSLRSKVDAWVGYRVGAPVPINLVVRDPQNQTLVMNYVFAGLNVAATSIVTDPLTGANTGLTYSPLELNNQGLPPGANLYSTAPGAIVDIRITFDNPFSAHRPQHDAAVGKDQRDYTSAPMAKELWALGFRPVNMTGATGLNVNALEDTISNQAFNLNSGTGGAAVYMWIRRSDVEAAITEVNVSTSAAQEAALLASGFTKIPQNLNEQSLALSNVFLWYKKGSGPAIIDVQLVDVAVRGQCCPVAQQTDFGLVNGVGFACGRCPVDFELVPANLNFEAAQNKIFLYTKKRPPGVVSRLLDWVPQVPGHYIMCYAGKEALTPDKLASTPRCIEMNVRADPGPTFMPLPKLNTYMGKTLTFKIAFVDIPHPEESVEIGMAATGNKLQGARFLPNAVVVPTAMGWETSRMVEWFPDAFYGGFSGDVCFTAKDTPGMFRTQSLVTGCVTISVERCKWWVQTEDTLVQVAARFQTNWLQIWHFNPDILHPDNALPPGKVINTGHMYEVEPSDALSALAQRFGTTVPHIRMNNWDMAGMQDSELMVGMPICVIPNSCVTAVNVQRI